MKHPFEQENNNYAEAKKIILINAFLTMFICSFFIFAGFFSIERLLNKKLSSIGAPDVPRQFMQDDKGVNYSLGEFVVNLSDGAQRYLKVDVTLELTRLEKEKNLDIKRIESDLSAKLERRKAAMRDAVITVLSSKNASTLTSKEGKELVKEQIAQSVDSILGGQREVLRVNFSQFVIQ